MTYTTYITITHWHPRRWKYKKEWFSTYQKDLIKKLKSSGLEVEVPKLVPNLMEKEKYVLH